MVQQPDRQVQRISLIDSLSGNEWFKLPLKIMQSVGPATQTLAGLMKVSTKETFVPINDIARKARLPTATVRKHLGILHDAGWIEHLGRQRTRRGHLRRTATIKACDHTRKIFKSGSGEDYGFLPWWACCDVCRLGRLPWCCRAVLSVVMARLAALKKAAEHYDAEADEGSIEDLGDDRFRFSLSSLMEHTGLSRESVVRAKRLLDGRFGIVCWEGDDTPRRRQKGVSADTDHLMPNYEFCVVVTPAGPGVCHINFDKGRG